MKFEPLDKKPGERHPELSSLEKNQLDQEELKIHLLDFGEKLRELLLVSEGDTDSPERRAEARRLRDTLREAIGELKNFPVWIEVSVLKHYPDLQIVDDVLLLEFPFGTDCFVKLKAGIIIEKQADGIRARLGLIALRREEITRCEYCSTEKDKDVPSSEDLAEFCEESIAEIVEKIGLGFLNEDSGAEEPKAVGESSTLSKTEHHCIALAFIRHWEAFVAECQRKEFLAGTYDGWVNVVANADSITLGNREKFALGFVIGKELERIGELTDEDEIPDCHCKARAHREVLEAFKIKNKIQKSK